MSVTIRPRRMDDNRRPAEVGSYCCSCVESPLRSSKTKCSWVEAPLRFFGLGMGVMNSGHRKQKQPGRAFECGQQRPLAANLTARCCWPYDYTATFALPRQSKFQGG